LATAHGSAGAFVVAGACDEGGDELAGPAGAAVVELSGAAVVVDEVVLAAPFVAGDPLPHATSRATAPIASTRRLVVITTVCPRGRSCMPRAGPLL
jgi:hypothetical protein